jgi:D-aminoacyl-tRNA deacylase
MVYCPLTIRENGMRIFFAPFLYKNPNLPSYGVTPWEIAAMILIVASTKDPAGLNIAKKIIDCYQLKKGIETFHQNPIYSRTIQNQEIKLLLITVEIVETQFITNFFTPQLLVFVSRHKSTSGIPTLSVHPPGNLVNAELGGLPRKVSIAPAGAMKRALLELEKSRKEMELNYTVSYECTHHGPSLDVPTMFVELGSTPKQWRDTQAAEAVAHAAMTTISNLSGYSVALGIGGPHYNPKFTKIALTTPIAFGHIIPKYMTPHIDAEIINQCLQRTLEKVELVILDWKGIKGADKKRLIPILSEMDTSVEKV